LRSFRPGKCACFYLLYAMFVMATGGLLATAWAVAQQWGISRTALTAALALDRLSMARAASPGAGSRIIGRETACPWHSQAACLLRLRVWAVYQAHSP
jgi:hypothetical protein